jgi:indolepyruvate ferredoxin oxidoreductase beta subunit
MTKLDVLVAGVGGQGTLVASDILAEVGLRAGFDVKKSDVLGLSVRGGSVLSHVRWGRDVASPVVRKGGVDVLLAFEPLEAVRGVEFLRQAGVALVNTQPQPPVSVTNGGGVYPPLEDVRRILEGVASSVVFVDATPAAVKAGSAKAANVVMLGAFSTLTEVPSAVWEAVILERVPERFRALNEAAFRAGVALMKGGGRS